MVRHALLANAGVEAAYWEWRAALERVPQAGTPDTNLAVFGSHAFGAMGDAWERTTLGLQTDPMGNLPPPSRLRAAAAQALEEARATGRRFEQAKWDLRARVYDAWLDYADDCLCDYLQASKRAVDALRKQSGLGPDAFLLETRKVYFTEFEGVVREHAKALGKTVTPFDPS